MHCLFDPLQQMIDSGTSRTTTMVPRRLIRAGEGRGTVVRPHLAVRPPARILPNIHAHCNHPAPSTADVRLCAIGAITPIMPSSALYNSHTHLPMAAPSSRRTVSAPHQQAAVSPTEKNGPAGRSLTPLAAAQWHRRSGLSGIVDAFDCINYES